MFASLPTRFKSSRNEHVLKKLEFFDGRRNAIHPFPEKRSRRNATTKPRSSCIYTEQRRLTISYRNGEQEPINVPICDPDPYYKEKNTYLVLNKQRTIHRFNESKALRLFGKDSPIRMAAIRILIHPVFNATIMLTIISNVMTMIFFGAQSKENELQSNKFHQEKPIGNTFSQLISLLLANDKLEKIFLAIYTFEMFIKIIARGFAFHEFAYLRSGWNCMDFVIIVVAYATIIWEETNRLRDNSGDSGNANFFNIFRAIRVLRVLKTVSAVPALRTIVAALTTAIRKLADAVLLSICGFSVFALIGKNLFKYKMRQKCFLKEIFEFPHKFPLELEMTEEIFKLEPCSKQIEILTKLDEHYIDANGRHAKYFDFYFKQYVYNQTANVIQTPLRCQMNPLIDDENLSNATCLKVLEATRLWNGDPRLPHTINHCPTDTFCLPLGENPDHDFTNFDDFLSSFLCVFRLSLQDNWEELYAQVLETSGPASIVFFLSVILFGSYYLINLILAVVASAYEQQRKYIEALLEDEKRELIRTKPWMKARRPGVNTDNDTDQTAQQAAIEKLRQSYNNPWKEKWESIRDEWFGWQCDLCYGSCIRNVREFLENIVTSPKFEIMIVIFVVVNSGLMSFEHILEPQYREDRLQHIYFAFTVIFTVECIAKIIALSPYEYFSDSWNTFDCFVVICSSAEFINSSQMQADESKTSMMTILRTLRLFRIVRILKLARSWQTLNRLITLIGNSMGNLSYLTMILFITLIIIALAGTKLLANYHTDPDTGLILRWHMRDFKHAFLVVFRMQCGECTSEKKQVI